MDIDSLLSQLDNLNINALPQEFSKVDVDDERARLYKTYDLARNLYNSNDINTKYIFRDSIRMIYEHYIKEISFKPSSYKNDISELSPLEQQQYIENIQKVHVLLLDYIRFSNSWDLNFSMLKIMEINKLIMVLTNIVSDIELDLSKLNL